MVFPMAFEPMTHKTKNAPLPEPSPRRRRNPFVGSGRAAAVLLTAMLTAAVFVPIAMAEPGDRAQTHREGPRDGGRQDSLHAEKRMDGERRPSKGNATAFEFTASGMDRDNQTYSLEGAGSLLCVRRQNQTSGVEQVHCRGRINATITDANGSIVKEGSIPVLLHARQNETGEWSWHMLSLGHGKRAHAILALRGTSGDESATQLALGDAKGGVLAKKADGESRLKVRLLEAEAVLQA